MCIRDSNIMWLDGVVLLPLVILGVDKLINENKCKLYVISLFIAIVSNYYIGYMICIFSGLYFIYKLILNNKVKLIKLGSFIGASILSVALSAFILIPTVLSLKMCIRDRLYLQGIEGPVNLH